jgi:putative two-component system response regulator
MGLALAALLVPVIGAVFLPETLGEFAALLWLTLLLPGFLLAYHRGWQGAATALAAGMATLALTHAWAVWQGIRIPDTLLGVVVAYLILSVGQGWLGSRVRKHERRTSRDPLTGLPDRTGAVEILGRAVEGGRSGAPLSVILFDLDRFRAFNERAGRPLGDQAIQVFGKILEEQAGGQDRVARIGGEEFLMVLPRLDVQEARELAERVRAAFRTWSDPALPLTASAGIAQFHTGMASSDELLAAADHALYQAKHAGRDGIRIFSDGGALPTPSSRRDEGAPEGTGRPAPPSENPTTLPRDPSSMGRTLPPSGPMTDGRRRRRVLLVEDDNRVRLLLSSFLRREGFLVTEASTGAAGHLALATEQDVVVTDIHLPDASGNDLVAAVKSRWPGTQVMVLTGARDAEIAAEALNAGADRYLFKPVELAELRTHLVQALARRDSILEEGQERKRLTREARDRAEQAREAILRGARALVRAVEVRDPYTKGHSDRVADYALALARELGEAAFLDLPSLRLACELHDVGKIGVPDAILNKETGLSRDEFAEVRQHPVVGRRILEPLFDDDTVLAVVSWHHERWDGGGYPDGLAGEAIPLVARITSIADTLDAMTSRRAYREALPWDAAVDEIRANAGHQFDPSLLPVFERALPVLRELALHSTEHGPLPPPVEPLLPGGG